MEKFFPVVLILLLCNSISYSQENIFAFYEYEIKDGMDDQFINGYEKDLEWHASQGDEWTWIGWFVMNGDRRGMFIDATPNHNWSDFDNWKVNSAENSRHNKIHWLPYVKNPSGGYKKVLDEFSNYKPDWFSNAFLQVYHIELNNGKENDFAKFLEDYKPVLQDRLKNNSFVWMKNISGGNINEYLLFVGINKIEDLKLTEKLFNFSDSNEELKQNYTNSVNSGVSELWMYSDRLSLIPGRK